jgi:acetyl esterase/lipase
MNKLIVSGLCTLLLFLSSCSTPDDIPAAQAYAPPGTPLMSKKHQPQLLDLPYGENAEQKMDLYMPMKRNDSIPNSKVFILLHGGGWYAGDKSEFNSEVTFIRLMFPEYTVVNINYRLGNAASLGFPKQINDIQTAIGFLDAHAEELRISKEYALIGMSAGAHLSMLYSYQYNTNNEVKAVCSIVGPTDFSDPKYIGNVLYYTGLNYFTGYNNYKDNPELYKELSPVSHVAENSPKTILFYGDSDPLVANTQASILSKQLTKFHVYNELYQYPGAGHANWTDYQQTHVNERTVDFFKKYF